MCVYDARMCVCVVLLLLCVPKHISFSLYFLYFSNEADRNKGGTSYLASYEHDFLLVLLFLPFSSPTFDLSIFFFQSFFSLLKNKKQSLLCL